MAHKLLLAYIVGKQVGGVQATEKTKVAGRLGQITDLGSDPLCICAQVRERATMLLLGTGSIGLAGYGRRKFRVK